MSDTDKRGGPRFLVDIGTPTIELDLSQIWPDGGAPENPTAQDVIDVMKDSTSDSIRRLMTDWGFDTDLIVDVCRLGTPRDRAEWR